ncbi:hypothetical protein MYCTH_2297454 [Thermothelomyces thermophilus ATCC 42464]|uniref:Uncharacterized protein n=1 Tax=Thermothelomyces thermophilus (strain ATCC 42464 / BCRC 31852 / DSM 1799) TaxID=573729 RepID=G2Q5Y2_THET4|nr:uncharacterized protein MYCTH_2297454 [Thermothelomyces thermophilus ATCC 42464]AEO54659.1 hypothetical protein MYCTH_2297454 [Thermothelomyces thermophilus ATCC 42464]
MITPPRDDDPWSVVNVVGQSPPVDCSKPYDPSALAGRTILITGGASGLGAAFARHWAGHGAHIVIGDINDRLGEELVAELRSSPSAAPGQVIAYQHCDVTSWTDQVALFQTAVSLSPTGSLDAVVAGAGIAESANLLDPSPPPTLFDAPPATIDASTPPPPLRVLAVNLTGVMYTAHLALHHLPRKKHDGRRDNGDRDGDRHLLLIASIAGLLPLPGQTEYTASKHAVVGMFRALRGTAWATRGVRVNALAPYFVDTPILPGSAVALLAGAGQTDPADVVDAATRLVADRQIRGRALCVGPKVRLVDADGGGGEAGEGKEGGLGGAGVRVVEGLGEQPGERRQAVWEMYGHDYARVETFVWRYLAVLNLMRQVRGWVGFVGDLLEVWFRRRARERRK